MADQSLTWWSASDDNVLPQAARDPWILDGTGTTTLVVGSGAQLTCSAHATFWRRTVVPSDMQPTRPTDRLEIQLAFQGRTNVPSAWDVAVSPHCIWIDDGARKLGVSIGPTLYLVDPDTGDVVFTPLVQPSGWTTRRVYHLIKVGTERWEIWVDGALVATLPYLGAKECGTEYVTGGAVVSGGRPRPTYGYGYMDVAGAGVGVWSLAESGTNEPLAPEWAVQRVKNAMPAYIQARWSSRHTAMARALVGIWWVGRQRIRDAAGSFTSGRFDDELASFDGTILPTQIGWSISDPAVLSVVRQRARLIQTPQNEWLSWTFSNAPTAAPDDQIRFVQATIRCDKYDSDDPHGRTGPYFQLRDGSHAIGAQLLYDRANPAHVGWRLTDSNPGNVLGNVGDELGGVDWYRDHRFELYLLGTERVIIVINDIIVEDAPYSRFTAPASEFDVRLGRDGSQTPLTKAIAEFSHVVAGVAYADPGARAFFLQRLAERCVFASGAEPNRWTDIYERHRGQAFARRGTLATIYEARRVTNDPDATLERTVDPSDWFLEFTYPEVTPIFLESHSSIQSLVLEFRALAPLIQPDALRDLLEKYFLPVSLLDGHTRAALTTDLTGTTSGVSNTLAPVEEARGFTVGEQVEYLHPVAGNLLTVAYDGSAGLGADVGYRDYGPNGYNATRTGTSFSVITRVPGLDTQIPYDPALQQTTPGSYDAARTPVITLPATIPTVGFTAWGRATAAIPHDGVAWFIMATAFGVGTGGFNLGRTNAGKLRATLYGSATSKATPDVTFNPIVNTKHWFACRYDPVGATFTLWVDGVIQASVSTTAFTPVVPAAGRVGLGCDSAGATKWKGSHRDFGLIARSLTDPEMLTLFNDNAGHNVLRTDPALVFAYLLSGRSAQEAGHAGELLAADHAEVATDKGAAWGLWYTTTQGAGRGVGGINGKVTVTGKLADRVGVVGAGHNVRLTSNNVAEDVWIEVYGRLNSGTAGLERLHVVGTTPTIGVLTWAEVHGVLADHAVAGTVSVADHVSATGLYQVAPAARSSGVVFFDPPLLCGPADVGITPVGATSVRATVVGHEEKLAYRAFGVTFNGAGVRVATISTDPNDGLDDLRAIALGYVDAAVGNLVVDAVITDRTGVMRLAGGTGIGRVYGIDDRGATTYEDIILGGADGVKHWRTFLGVELLGGVAGADVTVSIVSGVTTVVIGTIVSGTRSLGVDRRRIANKGEPTIVLDQAASTIRTVGIAGFDADGGFGVIGVELDGTNVVSIPSEVATVTGICTGHVPYTKWVTCRGVAWRGEDFSRAVRAASQSELWTATSSAPSTSLAEVLDSAQPADAADGGVVLLGKYTGRELATVVGLDIPGKTLTTSLVTSHTTGDRIREAG